MRFWGIACSSVNTLSPPQTPIPSPSYMHGALVPRGRRRPGDPALAARVAFRLHVAFVLKVISTFIEPLALHSLLRSLRLGLARFASVRLGLASARLTSVWLRLGYNTVRTCVLETAPSEPASQFPT